MITINIDRLPLEQEGTILDIGCGSGRHLGALFEHFRGKLVGADPMFSDLIASIERLTFHEALSPQKGKRRWSLLSARGDALPFPDGNFSAVILSEVLEHVPFDGKVLKEAIRVLKPNGILAVSVPRHYPERICWMLSSSYRSEPGGHIRIYTRKRLIQKIKESGGKIIASHHAHSLHTPYWWLRCLIGKSLKLAPLIEGYHRFLVWEIMKKPRWIGHIERLLNPLMGKSYVIYVLKI